jgi:hypothetical protein
VRDPRANTHRGAVHVAILKTLADNPSYALMRGVARFVPVRKGVTCLKSALGCGDAVRRESTLTAQLHTTMFPEVDQYAFLRELNRRGCAFGLKLPASIVEAVRLYAESTPVFAYRNEKYGFFPGERANAEATLGKEILLAQYYNSEVDCKAINDVALDPLINWIALKYLGSVPKYLGCNLWWTYPIKPSREDQLKHAHLFHRDVDDFKFIKFFFYITEVDVGDGGHWLVSGSHRKPPHLRFKDRFLLRRFDDVEVQRFYDRADILEVVGPAGTGFAEDTLCVHKAASPSRKPRLVFQLQFALFDFGVGSDIRSPSELAMICSRR